MNLTIPGKRNPKLPKRHRRGGGHNVSPSIASAARSASYASASSPAARHARLSTCSRNSSSLDASERAANASSSRSPSASPSGASPFFSHPESVAALAVSRDVDSAPRLDAVVSDVALLSSSSAKRGSSFPGSSSGVGTASATRASASRKSSKASVASRGGAARATKVCAARKIWRASETESFFPRSILFTEGRRLFSSSSFDRVTSRTSKDASLDVSSTPAIAIASANAPNPTRATVSSASDKKRARSAFQRGEAGGETSRLAPVSSSNLAASRASSSVVSSAMMSPLNTSSVSSKYNFFARNTSGSARKSAPARGRKSFSQSASSARAREWCAPLLAYLASATRTSSSRNCARVSGFDADPATVS
mmetsp:Transcript_3838/g.16306  ORF Transcript_3838/g.16306 Transcript_3838/m.16306 type:complete len:367 (-) Transcript_3838:1734-2834(-)